MKLSDHATLLIAFVAVLAAIVALVIFEGASAVKSLQLVPVVVALGGALAALVKQR